ncbi:MAG TPA: hypothetical protein VF669_13420 [Tepidisphaeraceae bacterium]
MQNPIIIKGRLIGPRQVELDEPVSEMTERVEVICHPAGESGNGDTILDFLRALPPGQRQGKEIDRQVRKERDGWGDVT